MKKKVLAIFMAGITLCATIGTNVFAAGQDEMSVQEEINVEETVESSETDIGEESGDTEEQLENEGEDIQEDLVKVTEELIVEMAQNLAVMSEETELDVQDLIPVYNINDEITGYSAAYYKGDTPYGYVVFDFGVTDYIKEYAIGENIPGIYDQILKKTPANAVTPYDISEAKIYTGLPMEYNIVCDIAGEESTVNGLGEVQTFEEFTEYAEVIESQKPSIFSGIYDSANIFLNYSKIPHSFTSTGGIGTVVSYSEEFIEQETGRYACACVALLNICAQSGSMHGTVATTFKNLWDATKTTVYDNPTGTPGIIYGETYRDNYAVGMKNYMKTYCNKDISYTLKTNATYRDCTDAINSPTQSIFGYTINVNGKNSGHAVVLDGYRTTSDGGHYIQVANGWWDYLVYINMDAIKFVDNRLTKFIGVPVWLD